jgi:hypothetical protein
MKPIAALKRLTPLGCPATFAMLWILLLTDKIPLDINHNIIIYRGLVLCMIGFNLLFNKKRGEQPESGRCGLPCPLDRSHKNRQ